MTQTGNPVFDFRAPFRRWAARLQAAYLWLALLLFLLAFCDYLYSSSPPPNLGAGIQVFAENGWRQRVLTTALTGVASLACSILWGLRWRSRLRQEFIKAYGPR